MRHLTGVVLAIVLAAAVFFAASWGYLKLLARPGRALTNGGSLLHDHALLQGLGVLLAVGLLAGLLIAIPRVSPLASGLPGLALLAWTALYLFSERHALQYVPLKTHSYGLGFEDMLLDGLLAMAGAAMIVPLFVPSRWAGVLRPRRRPVPSPAGPPGEPSAVADPSFQATQTMQADDLFSTTRPQPRIDPGPAPGPAQAPWGPAEYS
jgi:hypothetical protein